MSFDGGARHTSPNASLDRDGPRAIGAGAILWGPPNDQGVRASIAQVVLTAPTLSSSMIAEALGLRAGLALALKVTTHPGRIEIVGDNLPILRMAASNGKVKTPEVWQILEAPLLHAASPGWQCTRR